MGRKGRDGSLVGRKRGSQLATSTPTKAADKTRGDAQGGRFRYNIAYEYALMNILGKYSGHASLASDVSFLKKSMLGVVGKLRDRLRTVTAMDERLELTTSMAL